MSCARKPSSQAKPLTDTMSTSTQSTNCDGIRVTSEAGYVLLHKLEQQPRISDSQVEAVMPFEKVAGREPQSADAMMERHKNHGLGRVGNEAPAVEKLLVAAVECSPHEPDHDGELLVQRNTWGPPDVKLQAVFGLVLIGQDLGDGLWASLFELDGGLDPIKGGRPADGAEAVVANRLRRVVHAEPGVHRRRERLARKGFGHDEPRKGAIVGQGHRHVRSLDGAREGAGELAAHGEVEEGCLHDGICLGVGLETAPITGMMTERVDLASQSACGSGLFLKYWPCPCPARSSARKG